MVVIRPQETSCDANQVAVPVSQSRWLQPDVRSKTSSRHTTGSFNHYQPRVEMAGLSYRALPRSILVRRLLFDRTTSFDRKSAVLTAPSPTPIWVVKMCAQRN